VGLDPNTVEHLSKVLKNVSEEQSPRIILSLRSNEHVPNWLTRFILLTEDSQIHHIGAHSRMKTKLKTIVKQLDGTHVVSNDAPDPHKETHAVRRKAGRPRKVTQSVTDIQIRLSEDSRELLKGLEASHSKQYSHDYQRVNRLLGNRVGGAAWTKESPDGFPSLDENSILEGESLIEMKGVRVSYGDKTVLGNWEHGDNLKEPGLWWNVKRGERWGVFGPNGSGKTTLTALISSDHPQSYSLPIEFFGTPRLPEPGKRGISFFDIQSRIGFSSPELHAFFPKKISVRQALESAWADTPLGKTNLSPELDDRISAILQWFRAELCPELGMTELQKEELYRPEQCDVRYYRGWTPKPHVRARYEGRRNEIINSNQMQAWADDKPFGSLSFASQRVLLFLRAIVRRPDIVILDEAFSGMDPFTVQKCHTFLAHGDQKTLRLVRVMTNRIAEPFVRRSEIDCFGLSRFPGLSEQQALIIIAHRKEEVPGSVRNWLCLPEPGEGAPRFGIWDGPLQMDPNKWREVWNLPIIKINSLKYQQIHERRVNGRRAAVQRDAEARERKRVELRRQWNKHNKTRDRAHYHLIVLRRLDGEVRRVKLTAEMRKPDFRTRARTTQMLTKAELAYHEGTDMLRHANIWLWARSKMRFHRRKLRQRRIHKVPRSTALMSTRYRSKTEDVGLHGF
jgi:ABC-type molybdenum transport system ATPase subunit/photorepair protein PhrA